jgi:hypothetical protein
MKIEKKFTGKLNFNNQERIENLPDVGSQIEPIACPY